MPINWSSEGPDAAKQSLLSARGSANARPTPQDRGLPGLKSILDESALEKWARQRGGALDFVPQYRNPPTARPSQKERGLASPRIVAKRANKPRSLSSKAANQNASRSVTESPRTQGVNTRLLPTIVEQVGDTCWAAALESWLGSVGDRARQRTKEELLEGFPSPDKGFDVAQFRQFVTGFGMDTAPMEDVDFSPDSIRNMLRKQSALFISFHSEKTSPWWHDVVLYDVTVDSLNQGTYWVMNPSGKWADEKHRILWPPGFQKWEKRHFFPVDTDLIIGWKVWGRPGRVH